MLVEKINNEYRFTSPSVDGAFKEKPCYILMKKIC